MVQSNKYKPVKLPQDYSKRLIDEYEIEEEYHDHYLVKVPPHEYYAVKKAFFERQHVLEFPHDQVRNGFKALPLDKQF